MAKTVKEILDSGKMKYWFLRKDNSFLNIAKERTSPLSREKY